MEREVCKCLCKAVKKPTDEISSGLDVVLKAKKIWAAANGRRGFTAIAVKFNPIPDPGGESVLVIVFRSTNGLTEWLEYLVQSYNVPRDGDTKDGTLRVFKVWKRTLDEVSTAVGDCCSNAKVQELFAEQSNAGCSRRSNRNNVIWPKTSPWHHHKYCAIV